MSEIQVNTINEYTGANGVTIDGVLIKDGQVDGKDVSTLGSGGLVYLGGATSGTVSDISVNNVFSSTYLNYKIFINVNTTSTTTSNFSFVMRASSSDTTSNYIGVRAFGNIGGTATNDASNTGTSEWYIADGDSGNPNRTSADITLFKPNLAAPTNYVSNGGGSWNSDWYYQQCYGIQTDSTQFDGFTIKANTGTFSATYRVYGMVDS